MSDILEFGEYYEKINRMKEEKFEKSDKVFYDLFKKWTK